MAENKIIMNYSNLLKETYNKLQDDINKVRKDLITFLRESDIDVTGNETVKELITKLKDLKIMYKGKNYVTFEFNKEGYIINKVSVDNFIEDRLPNDVVRGYYKYVDGKVVIDHIKKRIITEV